MNKDEWNNYRNIFERKALKNGKSQNYINKNLQYAEILVGNNVPIIYNADHLGLLIGIKASYFYKVTNEDKLFYRKFSIKKKNGDSRVLHEPLPNLKIIQKWILENILYKLEVSKFAKAYIPDRSVKDNVRFHKNQKYVFKLDIKDFFSSISEKYVYKIFKNLGYTESLSVLLSKLCTLKGVLPQGASTSAYLSNLILFEFDKSVSLYCLERNIRYTRYADDLTFSGEFNYERLLKFIHYKLEVLGLKLNQSKTRLLRQNQAQMITGIVVNEKIQVPKDYRRKIRLEVYYIRKFGIYNHLKSNHSKVDAKTYLKSLNGKINYCLFINPNDLDMREYRDIIEDAYQKLSIKNL
ncbi:retron St85 family RNA-directed DNA polymerase [Enterococcus asini]|uniref:retron St85 family RNA-directed DNA polymerase n=1 Tax=Enterococcus asini TaxID=57732 RepID=UPI0022E6B605|nr:retron St85 family RNA-directed DNA polymerase [Enterococcus asini]